MFSLIYYAVSLIIKLAPIFEKFIFQTGARVRQFCFLPLVPGVLVARIPVIQATQVQFLGGELRSCFRTTHCCHSENKRTNYIFFLSDTMVGILTSVKYNKCLQNQVNHHCFQKWEDLSIMEKPLLMAHLSCPQHQNKWLGKVVRIQSKFMLFALYLPTCWQTMSSNFQHWISQLSVSH